MKTMSTHIIQTNGAAIRIADGGGGEPALVFLHYWGGSARTWHRVIERLGSQVRSVAIDQRGWGGSIATDGRYDLAAMADDVERVLRVLELRRYVLVGHSMGGKVAQIVATEPPQPRWSTATQRTRPPSRSITRRQVRAEPPQ